MTAVCPCCLRTIEGRPDPIQVVAHTDATGQERLLLSILVAHFNEQVNVTDIVSWMFGGRKDGGPLTAKECVKVYAHTLRGKIERYGLTITGSSSKYGGAFRLTWVQQEQNREQAA